MIFHPHRSAVGVDGALPRDANLPLVADHPFRAVVLGLALPDGEADALRATVDKVSIYIQYLQCV